MRVLVMGGTGVMGTCLVEQIQQMGHDVVVTTRQHLPSKKTNYWQCDARQESFVESIKNNHFDVIVDFMCYRTEEFRHRVNGLLSSTDHYFYFSSARVFADSEQPITEKSPQLLDVCSDFNYLQTDEYALAKSRQERILQETSLRNWTIVRPYITYGRNRLQLEGMEKEEWLYRAMQGRTVLVSRDILDKRTTMTSGDDVAKAIASLAGNEKAKGEDFNVIGTDNLLWRDVLQLYAEMFQESTGKVMKVKEVDSAKEIHYSWANYQIDYDRMYNRKFANQKLLLYVDISFEPIRSGLRKAFMDFMCQPQFKAIDWNMEVRKDRLSRERASLSEIEGTKAKARYLYHRYID